MYLEGLHGVHPKDYMRGRGAIEGDGAKDGSSSWEGAESFAGVGAGVKFARSADPRYFSSPSMSSKIPPEGAASIERPLAGASWVMFFSSMLAYH